VPNPFQTFKHRNFRLFWFGQTLSLIGTWMQTMAQGWLALELSNSAFLVGLVAAASSLPVLLFSFHAGAVVDRVDKLRTLRWCQAALGAQAATLWWFTASGHITIGWLIALAAINGVISSLEIPTRQSLVIDLVGRQDLPGAIALNSSGFNLARVVGPGVGAVVIARAGLSACFGLNCISYLAVLVGLFMIKLPPMPAILARFNTNEGIREGFVYMRDTKSVAALMKVVTVFSILGIPYLTMMPVMARDRLHLDAGGYGLLLACVGTGGLLGALGLAALGDKFSRGQLLAIASLAYAGLLILFGIVTVPFIACVVLLGVGFAMIVNNALCNALLQHLVPDHLRGRLMAAYSFVVVGAAQVFGSLLAGGIAHVSNVAVAIAAPAVVMAVYAYVAFYRRPDLRAL
jgi:MFS family permease